MKGTNLVLEEQTIRLSQKKTYSEAVMIAMKEFIRVNEFSKIFEFQEITIRSSMDCLIASIALRNHTTVIHKDRDYSEISKYTTL